MLQKEYEGKLASLMGQVAETRSIDSSSVSSSAVESLTRKLRSREKELSYYKQASREYKKKLKDVLEGRAVDSRGELKKKYHCPFCVCRGSWQSQS
jgi:hypothetical protein